MTTNLEKYLSNDLFEELKKEDNLGKVHQRLMRYLEAVNNISPAHDTELYRNVLIKYKEYFTHNQK